ncbi:MAG: CHASE3 domain-containing protein [Pseudomonadota bacterium]|nr:CHASE3 domain-containing protein [Pseudomonadota bacterium]
MPIISPAPLQAERGPQEATASGPDWHGPGENEPDQFFSGVANPALAGLARRLDRAIAWYLRGTMIRGLVVLAGLFLAIFLLMAQTVVAQRQARQGVMLQDESMLSLNSLMEIMLDAETGQRGFLLTSNPAYLGPYQQAKVRLDPEVAALQRMSQRSSDEEQQHIARAQQLIYAKIDEMDRTLELARNGLLPSAIALVQTNTGENDMNNLRRELTWLRTDQAMQRQAAFDRVETLEGRLLPLVGMLGAGMVLLVMVALRGERHRAWAEAEARQFTALRTANDQTELLARELNHRVKNLFSVVLSIITMSGRKQAPTAEVLEDIRSRVYALSLAHSSSQGAEGQKSSQLGDVIANIMRPYSEGHPERVRMSGPSVDLPARMITPMGLLIHELATNGSKYGALSTATGVIEIAWQVAVAPGGSRTLRLDWTESGGPALTGADMANARATGSQPKSGFGSRLTTLAAQQMGGSLEREWPEAGVHVTLSCPLP